MMKPNAVPAGGEQFETYFSEIAQRDLVQYEYRAEDGAFFSTVARTLEAARAKRDEWLASSGRPAAAKEPLPHGRGSV